VRLTDLAFDDWLEHVFGHEVRFQQAAWFFDHDRDWWDPEPAVAVDYLTRQRLRRQWMALLDDVPIKDPSAVSKR
jgi:hypothetical protein